MAAAQHYRAFLHRCLQYSLLSPAAAAMAQTALKQPEEEEEEGSGSGASLRTLDAATLRAHKIEKFKR